MNKKIVLLVITILIVASVFVIGIVGAAIGQTIITVKVTGVEFDHTGESGVENEDGSISMRVKLDEGDYTKQLTWKILPYNDLKKESNATNKEVTLTLVSPSNGTVTLSKDGLVTFPLTSDVPITATIKITTADQDKTDTIIIYKYYESSQVIG